MSIRAFIAVEIEDPSVLSKLIKVRDALVETGADLKPVEDENIHLTIRFLGHISSVTVEAIKRILSRAPEITGGSFEMVVKGVGAFPNVNRPRVIWAGVVEGCDPLARLRKYIDDSIQRERLYDVHRDQHGFSPHITLARVRSGRNLARLSQLLLQYSDYEFGRTPVTEVKLKQSILTPRGPIYKDIFSVRL
ncbi:MAG: RNA 2',3'-cyclic phosphodiesterase [Crenarchaeota archaeon]|nr:RNA 2',3'-cyclic phosphodiesterase [Thermoproteota archaeon]